MTKVKEIATLAHNMQLGRSDSNYFCSTVRGRDLIFPGGNYVPYINYIEQLFRGVKKLERALAGDLPDEDFPRKLVNQCIRALVTAH